MLYAYFQPFIDIVFLTNFCDVLNETSAMLICFYVESRLGSSATKILSTHKPLCSYSRLGSMDYSCARKVTTVLCIHNLPCPHDCNGHGDCTHGNCHCHGNWAGPQCDVLQCGSRNCSGQGACTEGDDQM